METELHKAIVIGAGPGGICAAAKLIEAGIGDLVVLEKSSGLGGTWNLNRYPGAECDIQSHLYCFSFEPNPSWSRPYSGQPEILAYLRHCAEKYGVTPLCRFNSAVSRAEWDEESNLWRVHCEDGRLFEAPVLIGAVGIFCETNVPDIPGLAQFPGPAFHSARWDENFEPAGQRVAVIGSAASAVQLIPELAKEAGRLDVYQRSPNWVLPKADQPYSVETIAQLKADPAKLHAMRQEILDSVDAYRGSMVAGGPDQSQAAEQAAMQNIAVIEDPDLRTKMVPDYPIGCRRVLLSNVYYPTFNRDNVELVTDRIERIEGNAIVTRDGSRREVDAIVFATGFDTMRYLTTIDVAGRGGLRLDQAWAGGPQAYRGVTVSGFPNLFMLYGPNTNVGSIIYMIEAQVDYIVRLVRRMEDEGLAGIEVRAEAEDAYNRRVQAELENFEMWVTDCSNYYRHPVSNKVVTQWPLTMGEYSQGMAVEDSDAYRAWPAKK
ncbi:MAG: flavin-containing monooxygenase [Novosphingobium sp.]